MGQMLLIEEPAVMMLAMFEIEGSHVTLYHHDVIQKVTCTVWVRGCDGT